jgi:hypothetical protein
MRGSHRLGATAVMSVARKLSVLRRITSVLDNFDARVHHRKAATAWKPTFMDARARLHRHHALCPYMYALDMNMNTCMLYDKTHLIQKLRPHNHLRLRITLICELRRHNSIHPIIKLCSSKNT